MSAYLKQHFAHNQRLAYLIFLACALLLSLALLYTFRPLDLAPIQCGPGLAYLNGVCVAP